MGVPQPDAMSTADDFESRVRQAAVALQSALIAAEMLATHGIVESLNYERLMDLLHEANAAMDQIHCILPAGPRTIFPNKAFAEAFIQQRGLDADCAYQVRVDRHGRCTIAVLRVFAHL
jgi:hypothetical protein